MKSTGNLGLNLLESTDLLSAKPLNENAEKLDTELAAVKETLSQHTETLESNKETLSSNKESLTKLTEDFEGHSHTAEEITDLESALSNIGFGKIVVVSYTGTGTYGSENPCSAQVGFKPKYVLVLQGSEMWLSPAATWYYPTSSSVGVASSRGSDDMGMHYIGDITTSYSKKKGIHINGTDYGLYSKYSAGVVYWYADYLGGEAQWNAEGVTYHLIFIGEAS